MNQIQKTYMLAKAQYEAVDEQVESVDRKYIADKGIVNADGSIPRASWAIDDDATCELAMSECTKIVTESGLWDEHCKARKLLQEAESELIKFGLSFLPKKDREVLERAVENDLGRRTKVLDLAFRLDTRTVKA
ncbi:hypothetical protein AAXB25_22835 [Paenibacillus lautus]|uniref:hypothetical protein n=1 Tax=Paenibacillus lautus TaxID=1401 RepID=UPI003D276EA1